MVACSLVIFFFSLMTLINIHAILIILTFEDMSLSADQDFFFLNARFSTTKLKVLF